MEEVLRAWEYMVGHPGTVLGWTGEHLRLILIAAGIAIVLGVAMGVFISGRGRERIAEIALYTADVGMTIPSLAMFGILMIILAAIELPSIGNLPVYVALVIYGQLPILRNTYTAIRAVDPAVIEAGRGMGMSEWQILFKIRLRLAVPVIMAGLRNAIVLLIGIATIGSVIGGGGLGRPIFRGLGRGGQTHFILTAAVIVTILAVAMDLLMAQVERLLTPRGLRR
ncbi:MAG: ABC transporter permease [Chloroflexota bacterium]